MYIYKHTLHLEPREAWPGNESDRATSNETECVAEVVSVDDRTSTSLFLSLSFSSFIFS